MAASWTGGCGPSPGTHLHPAPNYCGDFCVWWVLFLVACDSGWQAAAVSVAPLLVMSVLLIDGSGKRLM